MHLFSVLMWQWTPLVVMRDCHITEIFWSAKALFGSFDVVWMLVLFVQANYIQNIFVSLPLA